MARADDDGTLRPSVAGVLLGSTNPEWWLGRLSGKRPVYELPDESELTLTIFAAA